MQSTLTKSNSHENSVDRQFSPQAQAYLDSSVHAQGEDLDQLLVQLSQAKQARVLDLGCGAGHVSFCIAPAVASVVAYDLSESMLNVVANSAAQRGLKNIKTQQGYAEQLPFESGSFDFVFCRYSAHHWRDVTAALREVKRVLKPGGRTVFIDICAPGKPMFDTFLQSIEILRDPSHVRNYSRSEWVRMMCDAELDVRAIQMGRLRLEFSSWIARMQTSKIQSAAILSLQAAVSGEIRQHFGIEADGSFSANRLTIEALG